MTTIRRKAKPQPIPVARRPSVAKQRFNPNPTKYRLTFCDALIAHMSEGASMTSFAASINVRPATLHEWAARHPEFAEAKDRAMAKCQSWWEQQIREGLFDRMQSSGTGKDRTQVTTRLNANAARLVMYNLFNWSDRQLAEVVDGRKPTLEDQGIRPYREWSTEDLRTLSDLMEKYRRAPNTPAPIAGSSVPATLDDAPGAGDGEDETRLN